MTFRLFAVAAATISAFAVTDPALAHSPKHSKAVLTSLEARETFQLRVIQHDKHVIRFFKNHRWLLQDHVARSTAARELRFHRAQLRWTTRELLETRAAIKAREARRLAARLSDPWEAIRAVFGKWAAQAQIVASCESGHSTWAANGQYLGLFQMGSSERAIYGHGSDALTQARAAYAYFAASGYDWSPWQCKPW